MKQKFRAWDKYDDEMVTDINFSWQDCGYESLSDVFSDDRWIFMQSTGLFDKNGVEIFENDVIAYQCNYLNHGTDETEYCRVEFKNTIPYAVNSMIKTTMDDILTDGSDWRVIGNIHQHPDLLEDQNEI